jgi:hypothetical protein
VESNETDEMFKLGEAVFSEGVKKLEEYHIDEPNFIFHRSELIIKKRLAVVEFVNGLELILKAIMLRNGYSIYRTKTGKIFKLDDQVRDTISEDRTIELDQIVRFFRNRFQSLPFAGVEELRKLRNQIVHKGTGIGEKKRAYFVQAIDCLVGFLKNIEASKTRF